MRETSEIFSREGSKCYLPNSIEFASEDLEHSDGIQAAEDRFLANKSHSGAKSRFLDTSTQIELSDEYEFVGHALFEATWYWQQCQSGTEFEAIPPHVHYQTIGWAAKRWPHPLFNHDFYEEGCARLGLKVTGNPINHYNRIGAHLRVPPHKLFDPRWYARELTRTGRKPEDSSLTDYLVHGDASGLSPNALFSTPFYRSQTDVPAGLSCLAHYLMVGAARCLSPSPLFDVPWYLETYAIARDAFAKGIDPITHYLLEGHQRGLPTHPAFDPDWYNELYLPKTGSDLSTHEHFMFESSKPSGRLSQACVYDFERCKVIYQPRDYRDGTTPLVSVIIVNMNGEAHLRDLFHSLSEQTYTNFEVIFVDNNSKDKSRDLVRSLWPDTKLIALNRNAGFAEANNLGLGASRGELIALLNNDTRVDANWLGELVAALGRHTDAGAVTSRVRFWTKFRSITISSSQEFRLDYSALMVSLNYSKAIVDKGRLLNGQVFPDELLNENTKYIEMKLPYAERTIDISVFGNPGSAIWVRTVRTSLKIEIDQTGHGSVLLDLSNLDGKTAFFTINNAGSYEPDWLTTGDIGFGDFDIGQHGVEREVPLACGCAMVIRRAALLGMTIFASDLVAYYEDSELSRRLRKTGHSIVYVPSAIVYHRHSSTSTERSPFWHKQIRRNGILYKYMELSKEERPAYLHSELMDLNHYRNWLKSKGDICSSEESSVRAVLPDVIRELQELCTKIDAGTMVGLASQMRIGIYNRYWNTLGGGEAHALFISSYLARFDFVELISDIDFDVDMLGSYFDVDVTRFRKRLISAMNTSVTAEYDVFVNSTYMDETPSQAKHSFFIVSFPSRTPSIEFLRSYTFLANSRYTSRWMERWWGHAAPKVCLVEPVVSNALLPSAPVKKAKVILSVGRFFTSGHSKNQLQIVKAFKRARLDGWKLKMAGSIGDQTYFDAVEEEARGAAVELYPNASFETIRSLYAESAIYVHASGLGRSPEDEPENFEHFGMTVAEAVANGCFPVVFNAAGPACIVKEIGSGFTYEDETDMASGMRRAIGRLRENTLPDDLIKAAATYTRPIREIRLADVFSCVRNQESSA